MASPEDGIRKSLSGDLPSSVRIPIYDPSDQILSAGVEAEDLALISAERDRVLLDIETSTGFPATEPWDIGRVRGGLGLMWAIDHTPSSLGQRFDAHGVTQYPVVRLHGFLTEGIKERRMSMPFANVNKREERLWGAPHPHQNGGVIILSGIDKYLVSSGIETVVLGEEFSRVVDLMRKKYPRYDFIPWNLTPKFLAEKLREKTGEIIEIEEVTDANKPFYPNRLKETLVKE